MSELYNRIDELCKSNGINITIMCKDTGVSRGSLTDLKSGRKKSLSIETIAKIAEYFKVTTDYLITGNEQNSPNLSNKTNDNDIKFALFNGSEDITDEMFEEVKQFAEMVKLREEAKKNKK